MAFMTVFVLKDLWESGQYGSHLHLPCFFYICLSNTGFTRIHPQNIEDDGQFSSSEGSTVDCLPEGEGGESVDFELEESMEPDACFPDGEYYDHQYCLAYYSLHVNQTSK